MSVREDTSVAKYATTKVQTCTDCNSNTSAYLFLVLGRRTGRGLEHINYQGGDESYI